MRNLPVAYPLPSKRVGALHSDAQESATLHWPRRPSFHHLLLLSTKVFSRYRSYAESRHPHPPEFRRIQGQRIQGQTERSLYCSVEESTFYNTSATSRLSPVSSGLSIFLGAKCNHGLLQRKEWRGRRDSNSRPLP